MKRIIVCGSRTFKNRAFLEQKLDELTKDLDIFELVTGVCPLGADKFAEGWYRKRFLSGYSEEPCNKSQLCRFAPFPADWSKYGYAAGPIRNREMAKYAGKDGICVAFWQDGSRGTSNMMIEAYHVGMRVILYQEKDWKGE